MPDMKTAMSKVITEWEAPEPMPASAPAPATRAYRFQPTNSISRATFDFVKHNAGLTRVEIIRKLTAQGYKATSTTSLLTQMVRQKMISEDGNRRLFVNQPEYTPIKPRLVREAQKATATGRRKAAKAAPKTAVIRGYGVNTPLANRPSVQELLDTLSVSDARTLYDELRKIFGG